MNLNVVKKITIRGEAQGVEQTAAAVGKLQQGYERLARSVELQSRQMEQYDRMERQNEQFRRASVESVNRLAAANDNLAKSLSAANDNSRSAGMSFHFTGIEAASAANHLKTAAIAAYALSPAFRSFANPLIANSLKAIGPVAATAAGMALSALMPLLSFLAKIAIPIYAAVAAFQLFVNNIASGIQAFSAFQSQQVELQNVIKATGGASGKTAEEINRLADGMGDIGNARQAARALLEFQGIAGNTFDRALKASNDLASSGFGSVTSAAQAMGKALTDPQSGLDGLTKGGVRFTVAQKAIITDLIETGRRAEAYAAILDVVEGKTAGASAAAANTLSGAYKALADATQRGSEQFGRQILEVVPLQRVIELLATAVNALNDIDLSKFFLKFKTIQVIARTLDFFSPDVKAGDTGMGVKEDAGAAARRKSDAAAAQLQYDAIQKVILALAEEGDALRKSELQKKIDLELRKAQASAGSAEATRIEAMVTAIHREAEAIKAAAEARRQDEAAAKRQAEQLRRMDEDRNNRTTQLMVERAAIGLTAEAALALRLREEELGKVRRFGIAETPELVASIDAWAKGYAKLSIENERFRNALSQVKDIAGTFATSFVKDLANGVDVMDALRTAAGNLGNTLIDIGTKKLVSMAVDQAASMFGAGSAAAPAAILNTTAVTMGATWITSAQIAAGILAGESIQEATARVTSAQVAAGTLKVGGAEAGLLMNGPMMLLMAAVVAVGSLLSMWGSGSAKAKQEEEAQARAWEQWQAAGLQLASYFAKANGTSVGNIRTQLQEQQSEAERFIKLRSESQGFKSAAQENADPIIREIRAAFGQYFRRLQQEFEANFAPTIEAMKSGFGEDSPIFQAFQNVKSVGETLQAFIADAEFVFGKGSGQAGEARGAAQTRALSLLQGGVDPLSEVQKRMQEIQGTARGLQKVLEDLGMSSVEAARKIDEGVKQAIDALRESFEKDIQRQINELSGKGFINSFVDLFKEDAQRRSDAARLGSGTGDIDTLFGLEAQEIINRAKLTGAAFEELITRFPKLKGVVEEFSELIEQVAKRSVDDLAKARQSIQDELFGVTNNPNTTEGQLAALEREFQRRRAEETISGGELLTDLEALYLARRGRILEDANQKALEEAKRLAEEQARIAESLRQRVQSFQDMTFNALNDTSTLEGQLAALAREERRAREQEAIAGNGALAELNEAFYTRELAIRKSFGDRAIEEAKRVAEAERQAKNQAARGVLETIQGWQAGPSSTLSAQEVLTNAQAFYSSNLALAQGNPSDQVTIDAVNKWPQLADTVERALRAVYGSATQYQTGKSQLIAEGIALPTVQAADDPLVVALRNTVTAVELLSGNTVVVNGGFINLGTNSGTVSARLTTLATDLGGPGGVSERMVALGNDLGGTGGVSQRLIDLAGTVGTGNDAALRAKMIALAGEVNTAAGKAIVLGTEVKTAADKATELATAIGTSDNNGVLKSLKLFGDNLSDIATQLLLHFNELDIDRSGGISRGEFTTSLGNTDAVNSLFTSLDINGDNNLTQMELMVAQQREANKLLAGIDTLIQTLNRYIYEEGGTSVKSKIAEVSHWAQEIRGQTGVANVAINKVETATVAYGNDNLLQTQDLRNKVAAVDAAVGLVRTEVGTVRTEVGTVQAAVANVNAAIGTGTGSNTLQALNSTATEHLRLMKDQLTNVSAVQDSNIGAAQNNMLTALNKIVVNTAVTAYNTGHFVGPANTSVFAWPNRALPVLAQGGVIPPHGLALVSEHLNPTFLRAGPEPITVSPHMPVLGRAANDNRELLAEIRRLNARLESLERTTANSGVVVAGAVREKGDKIVEATETSGKRSAEATRMASRNNKLALAS